MSAQPEPPRRRHRAVILVALMLFGVAWLVITFPGGSVLNRQSLVALGVVILLAAAGGIAFSWRRYFGRR